MRNLDSFYSTMQFIQPVIPYLMGFTGFLLMGFTALHVVFNKHDTRAATGWLGLIWFAPVLGAVLYWIFGINRIQRLARSKFSTKPMISLPKLNSSVSHEFIDKKYGDLDSGLPMLAKLTDKVNRQSLVVGNSIIPLLDGDQAFPEMLAAIERSKKSVTISCYIFKNDKWGNRFRRALRDAVKRGVQVRALIDAIGVRYSIPSIIHRLQSDGINVCRFLNSGIVSPLRYLNLRNHRKILVVDGEFGFTGGINIHDGAVIKDSPVDPVQDVHFYLQGPIVAELQHSFVEDWFFTTGEKLEGDLWSSDLANCGEGVARGISDGPDEDFGKLRLVLLGALTSARKSIRISTPYFLPDNELIAGLKIAALRGVEVQILLPGVSNLFFVKWASDAGLDVLVESGCRIFYTIAPFDHSKLMTVDDSWCLIGSANWDSRSLNLNFEFNVECYDEKLADSLNIIMDEKMVGANELTIEGIRSRFIGVNLRNRLLRLFSPYL